MKLAGPGRSRARWVLGGAAAIAVAALFSASTVWSQPAGFVSGPIPERVRELEARVARMELRLQAMERLIDAPSDFASVRSFPTDDDEELGYSACDPPFAYDSRGVRLLKVGCEAHSSGNPCDPPFSVDAAGIKTLREGCEEFQPPSPCSPPYTIDSEGNRVVQRECLDVGY